MRAKTNGELDFKTAKSTTPTASEQARVPKNTQYTELYVQLLKWRDEVADENGVQAYEVLPTRSMLELVEYLPISSDGLKQVKGIGEFKARRYGAAIIGIIEKYCSDKQIPANLLSVFDNLPAPAPKTDTKMISLNLFKSGKTIDEIAAERGFVRGTIEGHLTHFVGTGELDIFSLMGREQVAEIEQFCKENQTANSTEVRAHFEEKYSYAEIRMVWQYMKNDGDAV